MLEAKDYQKAIVVGEIVEAATTHFVAQCPRERLHAPPAFGTFVKVRPAGSLEQPVAVVPVSEVDPFVDAPAVSSAALPEGTADGTLYALVTLATTGSSEIGRRPAAYGLDEAQLQAEQPQIFDLLCTEFTALPIGFAQEGRVRSHLPPQPPRLHAFVQECSPAEVCALTASPDFLRSLLNTSGEVSADELIAACLRHAYHCRNQDFPFLVRAGKQLAMLLRDDPDRLSALLRKLEP